MSDDLWVFGYGSLIWRPSIPYTETRVAVAQGFVRKFYQGSTDHRGVPGRPGRVVTLLPDSKGQVWGRAFKIPPSEREAVLAALDHREKGGYARHRISLEFQRPRSGRTHGLVYVATEDNDHFLGPASADDIARQVLQSRGPSGPNDEYVLNLAQALKEMGAHDPHVFEVESALWAAARLRASK